MLATKEIQQHIIGILQKGLDPIFTYHNLAHTVDVAKQAKIIAAEENQMDKEALEELHVAALFHDTGFLYHWNNHEEQSCIVARSELAGFDISSKQLENICSIIMATRLPHNPKGILQEIICDADLDYLGRDDFFTISDGLFREFMACGIVQSEEEWNEKQISFLKEHRYFTSSSNKRREPLKQQHIQYLLQSQ